MAGVDDESVLRARVLNGVSKSRGENTFRRLTKRFHEFAAACEPPHGCDLAEEQFTALMREIGICELQLGVWELKLRKLDHASEERDVKSSYKGIGSALSDAAEKCEDELVAKRRRLEDARLERQQFEEWKRLKAKVDGYPTQAETQEGLSSVKAEILKMEEEVERLDTRAGRKEKHFRMLGDCLEELKVDGFPVDENQRARQGQAMETD